MKKQLIINLLLYTLLFIPITQAAYYPINNFNELTEEELLNISKPIYNGIWHQDEHNNYHLTMQRLQLEYYNSTHLEYYYIDEEMLFINEQINWCYDHYTVNLCNQFILQGTTPINLRTLGYQETDDHNGILYPYTWYYNAYWIQSIESIIALITQLENLENNNGELFN